MYLLDAFLEGVVTLTFLIILPLGYTLTHWKEMTGNEEYYE